METGIVKYFDPDPSKYFGKIAADKGDVVFFHFNNQNPALVVDDRLPKIGDHVEFERTKAQRGPKAKTWNFEPYVSYPDLCHDRLGTTSQVGAYYVGGCDPYPDLSVGIRFQGDAAMYHSLRIHKGDAERFVARVKKWEAAKLANNRLAIVYYHPTEKTYIFSTGWKQGPYEPGFTMAHKRITFAIPQMIPPNRNLADGIISNRVELVRFHPFFADMRETPNPNPEFQDPESPLALNTVA